MLLRFLFALQRTAFIKFSNDMIVMFAVSGAIFLDLFSDCAQITAQCKYSSSLFYILKTILESRRDLSSQLLIVILINNSKVSLSRIRIYVS